MYFCWLSDDFCAFVYLLIYFIWSTYCSEGSHATCSLATMSGMLMLHNDEFICLPYFTILLLADMLLVSTLSDFTIVLHSTLSLHCLMYFIPSHCVSVFMCCSDLSSDICSLYNSITWISPCKLRFSVCVCLHVCIYSELPCLPRPCHYRMSTAMIV